MGEPLWKLVRGLEQSMGNLMWTMVTVLLLLYVFACFGTGLIGKSETLLASDKSEVREIVLERFQGILVTMLTLVQVLAGDITENFFPLVIAEPVLVVYFGSAYFLLG